MIAVAPPPKIPVDWVIETPDTPLAAAVIGSPNHGPRLGTGVPDMLILHYTGMEDTDAAIRLLCDPTQAHTVSAHYVVRENGAIVQLVVEARRAWHAGVSSWEGATDINSRSIGIEIANPGLSFGYPDFPAAQIDAVIGLCADILSRHAIRPDRVLAHSDIAPLRKDDPAEKFPWDRLHAAGIGHLVPEVPVTSGRFFGPGDEGQAVEALQAMLALYGYGLAVTGTYDETTFKVVTAFQRHFRRRRVDGIADASTITTLRDLIASRPGAAVA